MTDPKTISPRDLELHEKALTRLKTKLFSKFDSKTYGISDANQATILPPLVHTRACPGGAIERSLCLGGVEYFVELSPKKQYKLSIIHGGRDSFDVFVSALAAQNYTRFAFTKYFHELDDAIVKAIETLRSEP